jgi:hypothetical protein
MKNFSQHFARFCIAVTFSAALMTPVFARDIQMNLSEADFVFTGSVDSVTASRDGTVTTIVFIVNHAWKGVEVTTVLPDVTKVTVYGNVGGECGIDADEFLPKSEYLVMGRTDDKGIYVSSCTGTKPFNDAQRDFAYIESMRQVFSDVAPSHPNAGAIRILKDSKVIEGYSDGTFKPYQTINRAEFVKILMEANLYITTKQCPEGAFPDVSWSDWFAIYTSNAKCYGIVSGYADGTFRPADQINFVEAAKIIAKAYSFPTSEDPVWYKPFVQVLAEKNAIPLTIHSTNQFITRGEMAEIIARLRMEDTTQPSKSLEDIGVSMNNAFTTNDLHVGQKVGGMTVSSVGKEWAEFTGTITLSGKYQYRDFVQEGVPYGVLFYGFSDTTSPLLPYRAELSGGAFALPMSDALTAHLPKSTSGKVTVTISKLRVYLVGIDSGIVNTAEWTDIADMTVQ